ncbi:hypothetical protein HAX54_009635 [Datura stramonium]|uniref:Uncharacterized protein n=1 Tax=Datura stramonium TaxID=4076 RepID=A0ABS8TF47_DATST|nr:hypothetical protein [Datura stramonium]
MGMLATPDTACQPDNNEALANMICKKDTIPPKPDYAKALQAPPIPSPSNFRHENPEVRARVSTHNGISAIIFKARDYYGVTGEECKFTLVGKFPRTRPKIENGENIKEEAEISQNKSQTSYDKGNNKGKEIGKQGRSGLKERLNKIKKKKKKKVSKKRTNIKIKNNNINGKENVETRNKMVIQSTGDRGYETNVPYEQNARQNTVNEQKIVEETGLNRKEECSDNILEKTGENYLHENNESSSLPSNIKNMSPINLVVDLNDNLLTSFSSQDMVMSHFDSSMVLKEKVPVEGTSTDALNETLIYGPLVSATSPLRPSPSFVSGHEKNLMLENVMSESLVDHLFKGDLLEERGKSSNIIAMRD